MILERVGQFVDEDAPDDVSAAIAAWWDEVVDPARVPAET